MLLITILLFKYSIEQFEWIIFQRSEHWISPVWKKIALLKGKITWGISLNNCVWLEITFQKMQKFQYMQNIMTSYYSPMFIKQCRFQNLKLSVVFYVTTDGSGMPSWVDLDMLVLLETVSSSQVFSSPCRNTPEFRGMSSSNSVRWL